MVVRCEIQTHSARHRLWRMPLTFCFLTLSKSACTKVKMRFAMGSIRTAVLAIALIMTLDPAASGQRIYWGVIGGTNLTPDFPRYDVSAPEDIYGNPAYHFQHLPVPRSFIWGGLLE